MMKPSQGRHAPDVGAMDVMRPNVLDHYKVMESDGLEQLRTISEEMDSEDTVIMISTRAPYNRWVMQPRSQPWTRFMRCQLRS